MTAILKESVQDHFAPRQRKLHRRRVTSAPSSMNLLTFSLICGFAASEFLLAVGTVLAIETLLSHDCPTAQSLPWTQPWLTSLSFAAAFVAIYAFRFGYAPGDLRQGRFTGVLSTWCLAAVIVVLPRLPRQDQ